MYDDTPARADRHRRGRPAPADLHLLPPGPRAGGAGRADPAAARRPDRRGDRAGVPRARDHDGAADHPREEEDQGRQHPLPGAGGRGPARAAGGRARRASTWSSTRATSRRGDGDPIREDLTAEAIRLGRILRDAAARRARGRRPAGADAAHRGPARRPGSPAASWCRCDEQDRGGWDRALIAEGHDLVRECLRDRTGRGSYQLLAAINAVHTDAPDRRRHRLVADRRALRPARTRSTRARSSRSTGRSRSPSSTAPRWRSPRSTGSARADDVPRLARDPRRPAAPARPQRRGAGGVRRRDRGDATTPPSAPTSPGGVAVWRHDGRRPSLAALAHRRRRRTGCETRAPRRARPRPASSVDAAARPRRPADDARACCGRGTR